MALLVYYYRLKCSVSSFMFTLTFERGLGVAAKQGGKVIAALKKNIEENDFWNSTFFLFFHFIDNL